MKYRKKPVVIESIQWEGTKKSWDEIKAMGCPTIPGEMGTDTFLIPTLEGNMIATKGDWIIKGVAGEFYPCRSDIFEKTYEPVSDLVASVQEDSSPIATLLSSAGNSVEQELIEAYKEYVTLLREEISDMIGLAFAHGWRSVRFEEGQRLRDKIRSLTNKELEPEECDARNGDQGSDAGNQK